MDNSQKAELLRILGESIRLSDLSDYEVITRVTIDVLTGIHTKKLDVSMAQLAEMLAYALIDLGGFHRIASCAW